MALTSLRLRQFRCFESLQLALPEGTALFVGDNAQGKTSVLEAVCMLLRLHSPRTSSPAELSRFQSGGYGIAGTLDGRELKQTLADGRRTLSVEGVEFRKPADYLAATGLVVWMGNSDMELVAGGGDPRRRYLDFLGSQMHPGYRSALSAYDKALRSRNALLKRDAQPPWREIDAYTRVLVPNGAVLTRWRAQLVEQLQPHAAAGHALIGGAGEALEMEYVNGSGADLAAELKRARADEARRRVTLAGPHRDDIKLSLSGLSAQQYGSEGQQRTVALAMKLAQATLLETVRQAAPLLLLDDIFGELDPGRRNALLAALPETSQRLITTTHLNWLDAGFRADAVFRVAEGMAPRDE